ncbi:hypothetical protein M408DRAFT_330113 [Serendipita vermifera MAFF 305830]|uniref:Uncharacterized protein n=1 Tax=Serendipita vermifera MAFF 305830 TaxID=933852 RepID=A0A0C2XDN7_SERVB|nr:hypothetical protein M408DRAFT_330113 [Serendipita vermifera MAFF 305830]
MCESPNVSFQTIPLRPSPVSPQCPLPIGTKSTGIQPSFASSPAVPAGGTYEESGMGYVMREKKGELTLGVMKRAKTWALEEQRV